MSVTKIVQRNTTKRKINKLSFYLQKQCKNKDSGKKKKKKKEQSIKYTHQGFFPNEPLTLAATLNST